LHSTWLATAMHDNQAAHPARHRTRILGDMNYRDMNEGDADGAGFSPGSAGFPPATSARILTDLRPAEALVQKYRNLGVWRRDTFLDDLRRWRKETPEAIAISAFETGSGLRDLTYQEYAEWVERFAAALYELGVRPGQVVAAQLPNWWQLSVLMLACARVGAVFAPIMTNIRPAELERILGRLPVTVCVTVDRWAKFDHAAALAGMAARLPALRHRVVLGKNVGPGEIDFVQHFQETPWEQQHPMALEDAHENPDRVFLALFTAGTAGPSKGALHTFNTLYAAVALNTPDSAFRGEDEFGPRDRFFTPHSLAHVVGLTTSFIPPLLVGGASVLLDKWDMETALLLMSRTGTSHLTGTPIFVTALTYVARQLPGELPKLRWVRCGATVVPEQLINEVAEVFGVTVRVGWGMTEVPLGTTTRPQDPPDWGAHSDGSPIPGMEIDLRADGAITREHPAQLFVRGGGVALATLSRYSGELVVTAEHDEGWYDTGDLVVPDGRGGIQFIGRRSDRIGDDFMIPVNEVESALRDHPAVCEVALVGYPDGNGGELACAVVVPQSVPPILAELRGYLTALGIAEWYQPSRLEVVASMPRNALGKVRKDLLRRWLRGEAELTRD
jgi:cyclohexanecarboxylate-CoA ligase